MAELTTKNSKFKFTGEVELFIVRQYAEYMNPLKICENIVKMYPQYCNKDIDMHGEEEFMQFLLRRVYNLNPKRSNFPKKYQENFLAYRSQYLDDFDNSYLAQRRNRVRELDMLYQTVISKADGEEDPKQFNQYVKTAKDILKEMRTEMDSSKVIVQATLEEGQARIVAKRQIENLSDEELQHMIEANESGNPISISTTDTGSETDSSDGAGGTGTEKEES